jgi:hypothetical protein
MTSSVVVSTEVADPRVKNVLEVLSWYSHIFSTFQTLYQHLLC